MGTGHDRPAKTSSVSARFARWRRQRPFWGGLSTMLGAVVLLVPTLGPLEVRILQGVAGLGTIVLSIALVALAVISWTHVELRPITGVFIVLGGLISYLTSNLGGFLIGMILIVWGGSLIFAWGPRENAPDQIAGDTSAESTSDEAPGDQDLANSRQRAHSATRLACTLFTVGLILAPSSAFASVTQDPWWPPLPWPPTEEPADPQDPDTPQPPAGQDLECDPESLPRQAPETGSPQAEADAAAVIACWESHTGSTAALPRELPTLARDSPVLEADSMAMTGLDSGGVVQVSTAAGQQRALEFTMDAMRLRGMDQSSAISGTDARLHVSNAESLATLSGEVRLYAQRVEGKLFGAVPVVLTPETPPPVMVPELVITDATTDFHYVRGDTVDLPNLEEPTY